LWGSGTIEQAKQHPAEGSYMRRVVTALVIVSAAFALAACSSAAPTAGTTGSTAAVVPAVPVAPVAASGDILSPTETVVPGETFPTDVSIVPSSVVTVLNAKKAMLVFWYDPTTKVAADQRKEINTAMAKYPGQITLVALDYTAGLPSGESSATLPLETQKLELMAAALRVRTTPYILFVDKYRRITYRFAGFTDALLLEREILRATQ
jgi:hypothetical protein